MISSVFLEIFGLFWGILGPFLSPDLRGNLGYCYQLHIYIYKIGLLEAMKGHLEQVYDEYFPSQSHFYPRKLLRSAPLRAISGSSGHSI
jgi:hypothetical protein